jgi:HEAT repeat protein
MRMLQADKLLNHLESLETKPINKTKRLADALAKADAAGARMICADLSTQRDKSNALRISMHALSNSDPRVRELALDIIALLGDDAGITLRQVLDLKKDPSSIVRRMRLFALQAIVPNRHETITALLDSLGDEDGIVRGAAVSLLGVVSKHSNKIIRSVRRMMDDNDEYVCAHACQALLRIGGQSDKAVIEKVIIKILAGKSTPAKFVVLDILNGIAPEGKEAVPALIQLLTDSDNPLLCGQAALLLGKIRPTDHPTIEVLISLLANNNSFVASCGSLALSSIGTSSVRPLMKVLSSPNPVARQLAIQALGNIGFASKPALPMLRELLQDSDEGCRRFAARAVDIIEGAKKP